MASWSPDWLDEDRARYGWLLPTALGASLLVHVFLLGGMSVAARYSQNTRRAIEFEVVQSAPTLPPNQKTWQARKTEFLRPKRVASPRALSLPASNQSKPVPPAVEPPKSVFGVTPESVVADATLAVPVGNTLMKEPEEKLTPPENVKPYVQPMKAPFAPVNFAEVTEFPRERERIEPIYPPALRAQGIEGTVIVEVDIDAEGNVVDARLKRATGLEFDEAALRALRGSKYYPAKRGDQPVAVRVIIPVKFRLR